MDERHTQIREGAGLDESKLNQDFIEWLRRWSTPLLLVAAAFALGWVLYQRYQHAQVAKVELAFRELDSATAIDGRTGALLGSPETLKAVADAYEGVRAVPFIARLAAADAYLEAARTGVRPGATPRDDGSFAPEDLLGDQDREGMLGSAERLYSLVVTQSAGKPEASLHAIGASYGMAAIAETRGQADKAREHYGRIVEFAEAGGFPGHAEIARQRLADIPGAAPTLFSRAELPAPPAPPAPPAMPSDSPTFIPPPAAETPASEPPPPPDAPVPEEPAPVPAPSPEPSPAPSPQ